jgi:hypothetical protein
MEPLILSLIAIGLLVILVFIIYLIDRVNTIEKETRQFANALGESKAATVQGPFAGLSSKKLWDAMSGRAPEELDPSVLQEVRERYELVLQKHLEAVFQEGFKDGQRGMSGEPKNTRMIGTLRGQVESWLPTAQVNTVYKCGLDCAQLPPEQWGPVRLALDEAGQSLYGKALIDLPRPLSASLMPQAPGAGTASATGAAVGPAAPSA